MPEASKPETRRVTAQIDKKGKRVTLIPQHDVSSSKDSFRVAPGDTLAWDLQDAKGKAATAPPGFEAVITFVQFPKGGQPPRPLLKEGNVLRTKGDALSGTVSDQAFKGRYRYRVELVSPAATITLQCFWRSPGGDIASTGMGGGEDSGGPLNS